MNYEKGMAIIDPVTMHEAHWRDKPNLYQIWEGFAMVHPNDWEAFYLDWMVTIIYYLQAGNR